jgi:tetratricopeptide (TPR) repeat protein
LWKIIKDNSVYLLVVLGVWIILFPIIFWNRDDLYSWIHRKTTKQGYDPSRVKSFVKKGDSLLTSHFLDSSPDKEEKFVEQLAPHLEKMQRACEYYRELGTKDEIYKYPTWITRQEEWSTDLSGKAQQDALMRKRLPATVDPGQYWRQNAEPVVNALSYYKRALQVSGPNYLPAKRIHMVALSACRDQESILGFTTYIYNTEKHIEKKAIGDNEKSRMIFQELDEISQMKKILYLLRYDKEFQDIFQDYQRAITSLIYDTNFTKISPLEAASLINRPLALLETSNDLGQIKKAKKMRMLRGKILFEAGTKERVHYSGALLDFEAASEYPSLASYPNNEIPEIKSNIFEAKLYTARCYYKMGQYKETFIILTKMLDDVRSIDGREGRKVELGLLKEYHELRRETLIKLGRVREADEIDENDLPGL